MNVIVIGAGTSGLAAAHALRGKGAEVTVLEAKSTPGGRIFGIHKQGYTLDLGAQFFFKFYDTTFQLCRELGLGDDIVSFPFRVGIWKNGRMNPATADIDPKVLWKQRMDLLRFRLFSSKGLLQVARLLPFLLKRHRDLHFTDFQNALDLDRESLAELARRSFGDEVLEYLFQPIASCLTLGEPEEISAAYGLSLLWYALHELFTLKKGIGALTDRLYRESRDAIRLSTPARRVVIEGGAVRGVETGQGFMEADAVICTTTATSALRLIPDLPSVLRSPLEKARYSSCCHVMFGLSRRLLPDDWFAVVLPRLSGSAMAAFTDDSAKSPAYVPPGAGLIHCFTFGKHAVELNQSPDGQVVSRLQDEIRKYLPAMPKEPLFSEICRWDEAVCLAAPGMLTAINRMKKQNYRDVKGLFLAGEYMYMPSVEAALRSGIDAAEAALRS
jgi:protoporphyrinogen/coproporphyrinogen III oxidase